jgi:hypothetical protein
MVRQLKQHEIPTLRKRLIEKQEGKCPICKKEIQAPVLDHHHTKRVGGTGQVRGVLCRSCNVLLGKMENNCARYNIQQQELPQVLRNMADYLCQKQQPYLHPSEAPKRPKLMKSSYNKLVKEIDGRQKVPEYPKSGMLTKELKRLFDKYKIEPRFYA